MTGSGKARRTDVALLAAHRAGDPDAFGELFARHRDRLWAVAVRTTGNREDAADALQEAMISAFRRADGYRADAAVTTWLHRIVVNACLDRLRRNRVRRTQPLPDDLEEHATRGDVLDAAGSHAAGSHGDPESEALAAERRRELLAALQRLSPDQRAALVLVDMEAYPVEEAARMLGCPSGTVKSRCSRGRARLLALLEPPQPSSESPRDRTGDRGPGDAGDGTTTGGDASHPGPREDASRPRPRGVDPPKPGTTAQAGPTDQAEGGVPR